MESELVQRLLGTMASTIGLLNEYEHGWGKSLAAFLVLMKQGDPEGLVKLRESFGTIGSLYDICITRGNGFDICVGRPLESKPRT